MKKILAILASVAVGISAATSVIACGFNTRNRNESKEPLIESINIAEIDIPTPKENESLKNWKDRVVVEINKKLNDDKITVNDLIFDDGTEGLTKSGDIIIKCKPGSKVDGEKIVEHIVKPNKTIDEIKNIPTPNDIETYSQWQERVVDAINAELGKTKITKEHLKFVDSSSELMKTGSVTIFGKDSDWLKGSKIVQVNPRLTKNLNEMEISQPLENESYAEWIDHVIADFNKTLGRIKISFADLVIDDKTEKLNHSGNITFTGKNPEWLKGLKTIKIFIKADKDLSEINIPSPNDGESLKEWKDRVIDKINDQLDKGKVTENDLIFDDGTEGLTKTGDIVIKGKPGSSIEGEKIVEHIVKPDKAINEITNTPTPNDIETYSQWQDRVVDAINAELGKTKITKDDLIFIDNSERLMKVGTVTITGKNPEWLRGSKTIQVNPKLTKTLNDMTPIYGETTLDQWIDTQIKSFNEILGRIKITRADLNIEDGTENFRYSGNVTITGKNPKWLKGLFSTSIVVKADKDLSEIKMSIPSYSESYEQWQDRAVIRINNQLSKGRITKDDLIFEDGSDGFTKTGDIVIKAKPGSPITGKNTAKYIKRLIDDIDINLIYPNDYESYEEWQDRVTEIFKVEFEVPWLTKSDLKFFDNNTSKLYKRGSILIYTETWLRGFKTFSYIPKFTKTLDEMVLSQPKENQTYDEWVDKMITDFNETLGRIKITRADLKIEDGTDNFSHSGLIAFNRNSYSLLRGSKSINVIFKADKDLSEIDIPTPNDGESLKDWKNRVVKEINNQLSKGKSQITIEDLIFEDQTEELTESGKIIVKGTGTIIKGTKEVSYVYKKHDLSKIQDYTLVDILNVGRSIKEEEDLLEQAVNRLFPKNTPKNKLPIYKKDYVIKGYYGDYPTNLDWTALRRVESRKQHLLIVALENSKFLEGQKTWWATVTAIDLKEFGIKYKDQINTNLNSWDSDDELRKKLGVNVKEIIKTFNESANFWIKEYVEGTNSMNGGHYKIKIEKPYSKNTRIVKFISHGYEVWEYFVKDTYFEIEI